MTTDDVGSVIMSRVMRAINYNRRPGYHFSGNLLDFRIDGKTSVLEQGPHCTDENGEIDVAYFSLFFDIAMGMAVPREFLEGSRLATMSASVWFTGRARRGPLIARSQSLGKVEATARPQVQVQTEIEGPEGTVAHALASYAIISGAVKGRVRTGKEELSNLPELREDELNPHEADIVGRAKSALDRMHRVDGSFTTHLFNADVKQTGTGAHLQISNGPHITNRVGHLQGGIQVGLATKAADAALGNGWLLTGANVSYLRPGEGGHFDVVSEVINRGNTTATLSSQIRDERGRAVLHAITNHSLRGQMLPLSPNPLSVSVEP